MLLSPGEQQNFNDKIIMTESRQLNFYDIHPINLLKSKDEVNEILISAYTKDITRILGTATAGLVVFLPNWIRIHDVPVSKLLFATIGLYHGGRLLPPISRQIMGTRPDDEFLTVMKLREAAIWAHVAPWCIYEAAKFLWPFKGAFLATLISIVVLWKNTKDNALKRRIVLELAEIVGWINPESAPVSSVRGLVIRLSQFWTYFSYHQLTSQTDNNKPPYKYKSFENERYLRLLRLRRRGATREVRCELKQFPLDTAPPFTALSYRWSYKTPSIPLYIDGKVKLVTTAVHQFLAHEVSYFHAQYIWIDAICINQDDKIEKASQIPLMRDIYSKATCVKVWLSPPDITGSGSLIRNAIFDNGLFSVKYLPLHREGSMRWGMEPLDNPVHYEVGLFFSHDWFTRTWIIQETAVPSTVYFLYKGSSFSLPSIVTLRALASVDPGTTMKIQKLSAKANMGEIASASELNMLEVNTRCATGLGNFGFLVHIRESYQSNSRWNLVQTLLHIIHFQCQDPRDKVFAILGLLNETMPDVIQPNYERSTSNLSIAVAYHILSSAEWFEWILLATRLVSIRKSKSDQLPSWIVDFDLLPLFKLELIDDQWLRGRLKNLKHLRNELIFPKVEPGLGLIQIACS
jgi:hypothetical protein